MLKYFHSQKIYIIFYKIFSWEKIFIESPYHKRKYTHPLSPTTPSHNTKTLFLRIFFKSHLPTLRNNQTFPFHATQETTLWISPHPQKNRLSQSHIKKLMWKRVELSHHALLAETKPFWKRKTKFLTPSPLFLKLHLQLLFFSI